MGRGKAKPGLLRQTQMVMLYELEEMPDGTYRVGNSFEAEEKEAADLVKTNKAKYADCPIGVLPGEQKED